MKNTKRFIALLTAATMLLAPMSVSATTATGSGVLENDPEKVPTFSGITLPTMTDAQADFTLDPERLLHNYEPEKYTADTAFFTTLVTAASFEIADTSAYSSGSLQYFVNEVTTDTTSDFIVATNGAIDSVTEGYFLWIPDYDTGLGKFEKIATDNADTYFKVEEDGENVTMKNHKIKPAVCDGKIYKANCYSLDDADYKANENTATVTITGRVYDLYVSPTTQATINDLEYKEAESAPASISDTMEFVNRSTSDYEISASVSVVNPEGLDFYDTTYSSTGCGVSILVSGGGKTSYVAASGSAISAATIKFDVASPGVAAWEEWRSADNDLDADKTGGHFYGKYEKESNTYNTGSFNITIASAGGSDAWAAYAKTLTAAKRPKIQVVYSMKKKGATEVDLGLIASENQSWGGSGDTRNVKMKAPDGVTTLTSLQYSTDNSTWNTPDSAKYGIYASGADYLIWLYTNPWGSTATHVYLKFEGSGTTYTAQLW